MTHKPPCIKQRAHRHTGNAIQPIVTRSFNQTASSPTYKASYKGTQQGATSYIPYRSSKPPHPADVVQEDTQETTRRTSSPPTEIDEIAIGYPRRSFLWTGARYLLVAAIIVYSLYAIYVKWVDPFLTTTYNQWHYGDARISVTSMTIHGKQRDVLGIGYHGNVEIIILPDAKDPHSQAVTYLAPQPFGDTANRTVLLHPAYVNNGDTLLDIIVEVEGTNGVSPVLYGKADGTFQWNTPPA